MNIVATSISGRTCVLEVIGRLNATTTSMLKEEMKKQITAECTNLIIDLTKTDFIDSSGLSSLISGLKLCREAGGTLSLCGLSEQTMTVFRVTMLIKVFEIYPTLAEAEQALSS